ncbi:NAD-dependent epimerase/dehydratase family protein [Dissulfurirhabdus thermomarina]|uniref:NAD-dependent epimerase/dehydratase family protein n=1 Tax=Dissulfurirhabdus thermomarina TaxID=1765737 RepID=A0A6N9TRB8_DISTH|nr:NAD-dependent epimerase/dehydratase family protein [Dissulfurirhabdus thermomarina]NDY42653.1 NAD-dependent epimerase/dehydratase family protein [Dissulfurirhabdus thermomarina]NMX23105.1 NAD-dependent epimerase/dehydratase family protein [Dissulfurirhabdus thermomarina]
MKILVTGGAGFIGSNVVDAYIEAGHDVVVVDDLSSGRPENLHPAARFHRADIRDDGIRRLFEQERPDVLNHHAAQISVPDSVRDPRRDAAVNVDGFLNLMEAARRTGVRKVIFISSGGAIYGEAQEYPTSEAAPPQPVSPYAITKAVAEQYLAFYRAQHGLDYTVLRYSNVYGPRQVPHGEAGVVAIFMDNLAAGRPSTLYHFPGEPDGMVRDYCYVGDVAEANLKALSVGGGAAFNIATGVGTRTRQLYETLFDLAAGLIPGLDPALRRLETAPARPGDIRRSCLRIEKARDGLGWQPRTGLAEGLEKTLKWRLSGAAAAGSAP